MPGNKYGGIDPLEKCFAVLIHCFLLQIVEGIFNGEEDQEGTQNNLWIAAFRHIARIN